MERQLGNIRNAMEGGAQTKAFFDGCGHFNSICAGLNSGAIKWSSSTNSENGQPMAVAQTSINGQPVSLTVKCAVDPDVLSGQKTSTMFEWNGVTYNVSGSVDISFSSPGAGWLSPQTIGVAGVVATPAMQSVMGRIVASALRGSNAGLGKLQILSSGEDAVEASAGDEAAADGILADAEIADVAAAWGAFLGPMAAAAVVLVVAEFILHRTVHRFSIFNLTKSDVTWSVPYLFEGTMTQAPVKSASPTAQAGDYQTDYLISGGKLHAPSGLKPQMIYHDVAFEFVSDDHSGLGYVLGLTFVDGDTSKTYDITLMFDLPFVGENSLGGMFGKPSESYGQWYSDMEGDFKQTKYVAKSSDGRYQLTLTFDYLNDEHTEPDGSTGYYYTSMVVLEALD